MSGSEDLTFGICIYSRYLIFIYFKKIVFVLIYHDIKYYPFQCNLPPVSCIISPCLKSYHSMPHATHHSMSHVLSHLSCLITPCLCVINPCLMQLITFIDLSKCADVLCCAGIGGGETLINPRVAG